MDSKPRKTQGRQISLSQKEANDLLQRYEKSLLELEKLENTGKNKDGEFVGYMIRTGSVARYILEALKLIAHNQPLTRLTVTINNNTQTLYPLKWLLNFICDDVYYSLNKLILQYGGSDNQFKNSLQEFQNFILQKSNVIQSTHHQVKKVIPPSLVKPKIQTSSDPEKGVSYTEKDNNYSMHFRIPPHKKHDAQNIVDELRKQEMPISILDDIITIGPSRGMGTCGAYLTGDVGYDSIDYEFGIKFKNEAQRNTFANLVDTSIPNSGNRNKLTFMASDIKKSDKPEPKPITHTPATPAASAKQSTKHQQPTQNIDDTIKNIFTTLGDHTSGKWTILQKKPKWEFGRSGYSNNVALASDHVQIEYNDKNQIIVLNKSKPRYTPANDGERYYALRSALQLQKQTNTLTSKAQELMHAITSQIETYYQRIKEKPDEHDNIKMWRQKIGVLGEAMSVLDGNHIDIDKTAAKYPLCRAGDGFIMTSETTKLLNKVKNILEEQSHKPTSPRSSW